MLRTVETLFVITLVFTTFATVLYYTPLPPPRTASNIGLNELSESVLNSLDADGSLTNAAFSNNASDWSKLLKSIDASVPVGVVYKVTAYEIDLNQANGTLSYTPIKTGTNAVGDMPSGSISTSYTISSPNVTITQTPEKIGAKQGKALTLYILDCDDANGWWTTGFTSGTLASDVNSSASPYFGTTIIVKNTTALGNLLAGRHISNNPKENIQGAVIVNTFGESIPVPSNNATNFMKYPYYIGTKVNRYNWTWVSIVGYPFYYASNKVSYSGAQNSWGIYGMQVIGAAGLNAFLQGIDGRAYTATPDVSFNPSSATGSGWTNPTYAYSQDSQSATTTINNSAETYSSYGASGYSDGMHIILHLNAYASTSGKSIKLEVYDGTTWYTVATQSLGTSQNYYTYDITSLTSWTSAKVSSLKTRITSVLSSSTIYVDWVGVEINPWITGSIGVVSYTNLLNQDMNYYGIYPGHSQTSTRALPLYDLSKFNLVLPKDSHGVNSTNIFNPVNGYYAGATWAHKVSGVTKGSLLALGLDRTPDIRVVVSGVLAQYRPSIVRSNFDTSTTTRIVVLQLGQVGGG